MHNIHDLSFFFQQASLRDVATDHIDEGYLSSSHGFLPRIPPQQTFFGTYPQLEQILFDLPELISSGILQKTIIHTSPIHISKESIDPRDVRRMSTALGILVHGFVVEHLSLNNILQTRGPIFRYDPEEYTMKRLPTWLWDAWNTINECNNRLETSLSFGDLVINNWKKKDPTKEMIVENLEMLIPYTRLEEEKIFYMTFVETLAYTTPLLPLIIDFGLALNTDDLLQAKKMLQTMDDILRHSTHITLPKINPIERSALFCDPVLWALFVSPLSMPIRKGEVGLSGAAIPFAHLLDAFFHRGAYDSKLGRNIKESHIHLPKRHQQLFLTIHSLDFPKQVSNFHDSELENLFIHIRHEYAGVHGWLGRHRLKVYGFMDAGFRLGRSSTNGGFSGTLQERSWDELDEQLDNARKERLEDTVYQGCARVHAIVQESPIHYTVTLDVQQLGCAFLPGDHVAIVPTNNTEEIQEIVDILDVEPEHKIPKAHGWHSDVESTEITICSLLAQAQLHPAPRESLLKLYSIFPSHVLEEILENHDEEIYDIKTILSLLKTEGYNFKNLLSSSKSSIDTISHILLPHRKRYYSVASYDPTHAYIDLCIRHVSYQSMGIGQINGTTTHWLIHNKPQAIPIYRVASNRFSLPNSPKTPCIMFAAGSGIAPFRSFWQYRAEKNENRVSDRLFFGSRSQTLYKQEWEMHIANNTLDVYALCSREDRLWYSQEQKLIETKHPKGYLSSLITTPNIATEMRDILCSDPALETTPCLYICGQGGFAKDILNTLIVMVPQGEDVLARFHAYGKLKLNIFNTFAGKLLPEQEKTLLWSDLLLHNSMPMGIWIAIKGKVYDIQPYLAMHPGGKRILSLYAGIDATTTFQKMGHHQSPDIMSQLDMFQIGILKRHSFGRHWTLMLNEGKTHIITLRKYYALWVGYGQAIAERENILSAQKEIFSQLSPLQLHTELGQLLALEQVYNPLFVTWPQELWAASISFWAKEKTSNEYQKTLERKGYYTYLTTWSDVIQKQKHLIDTQPEEVIQSLRYLHFVQQTSMHTIKMHVRKAILILEQQSFQEENYGNQLLSLLEELSTHVCLMLQLLTSSEGSE